MAAVYERASGEAVIDATRRTSARSPIIPRIVHCVWLQGEAHLREHEPRYWENVRQTQELFGEDWNVKLWNEPAIIEVIERVAPHVLARFLSLTEPAMKADVARFTLLKAYGGIYLDIDFIVTRSMAPLCDLAPEPYVALRRLRFGSFVHSLMNGTLSSVPEGLQTYLIISSPGHPLWDRLIDHITQFRPRRVLEHPALYYTRFTCLNALGRAVHRHRQEHAGRYPVIHITHISDFYGSHIGKGEWAGLLTTYGESRRTLAQNLNWLCVSSIAINVILLALVLLLLVI